MKHDPHDPPKPPQLTPADLASAELAQAIETAGAVIGVIADCIRDAGPAGAISGHLYASVMGVMSLSTYNHIIAYLEFGGRIKVVGHTLYWQADTRTSAR